MASRAFWTAEEEAILESHANDKHWFPKVREMLPERSDAALRKRMFEVRSENGGDRRYSINWISDARRAADRLLEALQAAGQSAA